MMMIRTIIQIIIYIVTAITVMTKHITLIITCLHTHTHTHMFIIHHVASVILGASGQDNSMASLVDKERQLHFRGLTFRILLYIFVHLFLVPIIKIKRLFFCHFYILCLDKYTHYLCSYKYGKSGFFLLHIVISSDYSFIFTIIFSNLMNQYCGVQIYLISKYNSRWQTTTDQR